MSVVAALLRLGCVLVCLSSLSFCREAAAATTRVVSPADGDAVAAGTVTLVVKVSLDPGQALRGLTVQVDGVALKDRNVVVDAGDADAGGASGPGGPGADLHRLQVVLAAGTHQLDVIPEVSVGTAGPARVRLHVSEASSLDPLLRPRMYALVVGISGYKDPSLRLRFPGKDAADLAALLQRQAGGLYRDVQVRLLTDEAASKAGVLDGLEWLQRQATARDVAVLFLAGHGIRDGSTGLYYFLPADAELASIKRTLISQDEFQATLRSLPGKVLVFLDTCFAGQLMRRQDRSPPDLGRLVSDLISADSGLVVFASSSGRQTSQESPEWQNGAFTRALLEGLSGRAATPGRSAVTLTMLELYLSDRVKQLTGGTQTPTVARPEAVPDFPLSLAREDGVPPSGVPVPPAPSSPPSPSPPEGGAPVRPALMVSREPLRVDAFGQSFAVYRGPARRPIGQPEFFMRVERPDLAAQLRKRSRIREGLLIGGGLGAALGVGLLVGGGVAYASASESLSSYASDVGMGQGLLAGGGVALGISIGLLIAGTVYRPEPITAYEAQSLAEAHNRSLGAAP